MRCAERRRAQRGCDQVGVVARRRSSLSARAHDAIEPATPATAVLAVSCARDDSGEPGEARRWMRTGCAGASGEGQ